MSRTELRDLAWDLEFDFENLPAIAKKHQARDQRGAAGGHDADEEYQALLATQQLVD